MSDTSDLYLDVECAGCGRALTVTNAGGFRTYCQQCVDAMPPLPAGNGGFVLIGRYPHFAWEPLQRDVMKVSDATDILRVYRKLHPERTIGQHWLWTAIERVAAGEPEQSVLEDYGYVRD